MREIDHLARDEFATVTKARGIVEALECRSCDGKIYIGILVQATKIVVATEDLFWCSLKMQR